MTLRAACATQLQPGAPGKIAFPLLTATCQQLTHSPQPAPGEQNLCPQAPSTLSGYPQHTELVQTVSSTALWLLSATCCLQGLYKEGKAHFLW